MIITKEQQEALISNYVKEKHNQDECIGFIDGIEKLAELVKILDGNTVKLRKSFYMMKNMKCTICGHVKCMCNTPMSF